MCMSISGLLLCQETGDPSAVLWYEEIQQTVDMANTHRTDAANCTSSSTYICLRRPLCMHARCCCWI